MDLLWPRKWFWSVCDSSSEWTILSSRCPLRRCHWPAAFSELRPRMDAGELGPGSPPVPVKTPERKSAKEYGVIYAKSSRKYSAIGIQSVSIPIALSDYSWTAADGQVSADGRERLARDSPRRCDPPSRIARILSSCWFCRGFCFRPLWPGHRFIP